MSESNLFGRANLIAMSLVLAIGVMAGFCLCLPWQHRNRITTIPEHTATFTVAADPEQNLPARIDLGSGPESATEITFRDPADAARARRAVRQTLLEELWRANGVSPSR